MTTLEDKTRLTGREGWTGPCERRDHDASGEVHGGLRRPRADDTRAARSSAPILTSDRANFNAEKVLRPSGGPRWHPDPLPRTNGAGRHGGRRPPCLPEPVAAGRGCQGLRGRPVIALRQCPLLVGRAGDARPDRDLVPSAALLPDTSRHLPELGLRSVPSAWACQFCAPLPLQVHNCTSVPSAVPAPDTSRHLPNARSTWPDTVQVCAVEPLQVNNWIFVPSAVPRVHVQALPGQPPHRAAPGLEPEPRVNESTSSRPPPVPVNTRYTGPDPAARVVVKFCQVP